MREHQLSTLGGNFCQPATRLRWWVVVWQMEREALTAAGQNDRETSERQTEVRLSTSVLSQPPSQFLSAAFIFAGSACVSKGQIQLAGNQVIVLEPTSEL